MKERSTGMSDANDGYGSIFFCEGGCNPFKAGDDGITGCDVVEQGEGVEGWCGDNEEANLCEYFKSCADDGTAKKVDDDEYSNTCNIMHVP